MDQREENILVALAQQYAPQLLPMWDQRGTHDERLPRLARGLASYNILVIMADQPYSLQTINQDISGLLNDWVNGYVSLYRRLCQDLFPSYAQVSAHYTDERWPVVIYIRGEATPVIQRLAGFVAPYIVERQFSSVVSDAELIGLMDMILDELEAASLTRDKYKKLRDDAVIILKTMLNSAIQQIPVTEFDRPIFSDSQRIVPIKASAIPPSIPEANVVIQPPGIHLARQADTQQLMPTDVIQMPKDLPESLPPAETKNSRFSLTASLFGSRKNKENDRKPRPPVMPLPDKPDKPK